MLGLGTLLLLGTIAPAQTCPSFPTDPATLVADSASAILGVDVDAFAKTSTGRALLPALRADLQLAEALEVLDDCQLSLERTYAMVLARDQGDGRMAIIQAHAIGADSTLACLGAELRARLDGAEPWTPETNASCHESLTLIDGSRAWRINDYTVVWASGSLIEPTAARLDGREATGLPSALGAELGRLDRSGQLWLAAKLDDDARRALPGAWARSAQSATAAIDLSDGLRAVVSLSAPDVTATANLRDLVLAGFADLADRLDDYGVDHHLREHARVGIVEGVVAAELRFDEAELRSLRAKIGERVRGRGPL